MLELITLIEAVFFAAHILVRSVYASFGILVFWALYDTIFKTYNLDLIVENSEFFWWFIVSIITVRVLFDYEKIAEKFYEDDY